VVTAVLSVGGQDDSDELHCVRLKVTTMGTTLHPLKDTFRIPRKVKNALKKQMKRWLRRWAKTHPDEVPRTQRHKGSYW
jgi:hypothetical protein